MNAAVLKRLEGDVVPAVRKRAAGYLTSVVLHHVDIDSVEAMVSGTEEYDVSLSTSEQCLAAYCSCPYVYTEDEPCKHIWATLLVLSRDRSSFGDAATHIDVTSETSLEEHFTGELPQTPAPLRLVPRTIRDAPTRSRWREAVQPLHNASTSSEFTRHAKETLRTPLLYVINNQRSHRMLLVDLLTRPLKKNGEPGALRDAPLTAESIAPLDEPDRELVATLLSGRLASSYYTSEDLTTNIVIGWPAALYLLPRVAATGRLHLDITGRRELTPPLAWDDGGRWEVAVNVTPSADGYRVTGSIVRGDETIPIERVHLITAGGVAITDTHIHVIDDGDSFGWATMLQRQALDIPRNDAKEFASVAAAATAKLRWNLPPELQWEERRVEPRAVLVLDAEHPYDDLRNAQAFFDYGGMRFPWPPSPVPLPMSVRYVRNVAREQEFVAQLEDAGVRREWMRLQVKASRVTTVVRALIAQGWYVESGGKPFRAAGKFRLKVSSGIDWFDIEGEATFGEQSIGLPELLRAIDGKHDTVTLPDGTTGLIDQEWMQQLAPLMRNASRTKGSPLRFKHSQLPLIDVLLASLPEVQIDEKVEEARAKLRSVRAEALDPPPGFIGTLRNYQRDALGWMAALRAFGFGGCLADDMGLGKTVQVLAMLEARRTAPDREGRPTLIVVPRSLVFNWKAEAARFTPQLRVLDLSGSERHDLMREAGSYDVLITTYALLRRDVPRFASIPLDYAIIDEAQAVKNIEAATSKAVRLLDARHRLALTGTPVENSVSDLTSIFEFTNPGMLSTAGTRTGSLIRTAASRTDDGRVARELVGRVVRPFILRRTKAQVAPELPARVEKTIYCDLSESERRGYDELRDHYRAIVSGTVESKGLARSKMHILEALLRLRQAACHPRLVRPGLRNATSTKFEVLLAEIRDIVSEGHKAIIFSQFTTLLGFLREELDESEYVYEYLDGKTRDRQGAVERFQTDPSIPLFLISLKAGGTGLNLTAAEYVFVLDPWWNPAVEAQAIDRTHRIGQTKTVFAYRLVARDTIEEKILQLQASKRELAEAIITEDNSLLRQITEEDLAMLLG